MPAKPLPPDDDFRTAPLKKAAERPANQAIRGLRTNPVVNYDTNKYIKEYIVTSQWRPY
jgi:hypothetical protein